MCHRFPLVFASRANFARFCFPLVVLLLLFVSQALAAEVMPPKPARYFNDYAGVVSSGTAQKLNQQLEDFEKATSSQVVVAVFPKMQSGSSIEDYTIRIARSWGVGQADKKNGAVLFVFVQDRRMRIEVGYGLEGVLPDALCKRIIEEQIKPYFKKSEYNGGLSAGVTAILQATRGEYKGTGRTVAQGRRGQEFPTVPVFFPILFPLLFPFVFPILFLVMFRKKLSSLGRGTVYSRSNRSTWSDWSSGGWGGGGSAGGGGSSGGGFSGGGGDFGGGGASGSW